MTITRIVSTGIHPGILGAENKSVYVNASAVYKPKQGPSTATCPHTPVTNSKKDLVWRYSVLHPKRWMIKANARH